MSELFPRASIYRSAAESKYWAIDPDYINRVQYEFDGICANTKYESPTEDFTIEAIEILLLAIEKVGLK